MLTVAATVGAMTLAGSLRTEIRGFTVPCDGPALRRPRRPPRPPAPRVRAPGVLARRRLVLAGLRLAARPLPAAGDRRPFRPGGRAADRAAGDPGRADGPPPA